MRSFAVLPPSGAGTSAALASLKGKTAAVIVWDAATEHRQVVVTGGSYESMRREALTALATAGLQTQGVLADIAPAGGRPARGGRRPVVVALASAADISAALAPLRAAGIQIRTVTTAAAALDSLARLRRTLDVAGAIEAYAALEQHAICIALVRDGVLVAARELPWGYVDASGEVVTMRPREEIASRLVDEISAFVTAIGGEPHEVGQVCVMGGLPELRSTTALMTERLDVEVEPLDSLFGIDASQLPQPADEFRDRSAELRLAWAAAADWPPAIDLFRSRHRATSRTTLSRAAVAAGIVAGLLAGWRIQQSQWWQSTGTPRAPQIAASTAPVRERPVPTVARPAASVVPASTVSAPRPAPPAVVPTVATAPSAPRPVPQPVAPVPSTTAPTVIAANRPALPPTPVRQEPPAVGAESPRLRAEPPAPAPRTTADPVIRTAPATASAASRGGPPQEREVPRTSVARSSLPSVSRTAQEPIFVPAVEPARFSRGTSGVPAEVPLPFDAALGTILYSSDRKLAIIDGRIIGVGDEIRGARVVEITQSAVLLRDGQGHLRRLAVGAGAR